MSILRTVRMQPRKKSLRKQGDRVLSFWNNDVLKNKDGDIS